MLAVSFEFNYIGGNTVGFNDPVNGGEFRTALESAATRLGDWLLHDTTLQIDVESRDFNGTAVAKAVSESAGPIAGGGFAHAVIPNKVIEGVDLNGSAADGRLEVFFFDGSDSFTYLTDPTQVAGDDEIDFQAVMIHELVHTLGWTSATNAGGSDDQGNGLTTPGTWSVFDQFLSDSTGDRLIDANATSPTAFQMDTAAWATHSVGGKGPNAGLFFDGPIATSVYGARVPLYSPSTFLLESSAVHLDSEGFPSETFLFSPRTHLMTHAIVDGPVPQELTLLEKAILADIGIQVRENVRPELTVPANLAVEANSRSGFLGTNQAINDFLDSATAVDLIDPAPVVTNDIPSTLVLGQNPVTFTATDASGNTSTAAAVISVFDTTPPELEVDPTSVTLEATSPEGIDKAALPFVVTASDIVDPNPIVTLSGGDRFPIGATTATYSARDFRNNVANVDVQIVVQDTTPPEISLPASITIDSNRDEGADLANEELIDVIRAASSDVADLDLAISAEPSLFPLGTTEVTFTVTDDSGNASMATTSVTVNDAALVVRTLDDELDANPQNDLDDLSLREAIALANANPGIDQIRFAVGLTGTVMLQPSLGQLIITDSVTLSGLGVNDTVIDGQSANRVLAIFGDQIDVAIDDLTIRNGTSNGNLIGGAGIYFESAGSLQLGRVRIADNVANGLGGAGGGIQVAAGSLTLVDSFVTGNQTTGDFASGGGLWFGGNDLEVTGSRFADNTTTGTYASGGGLYILDGAATVTSSTLSENGTTGVRSGGGGLAVISGEVTIRNSTISGNTTGGAMSPGGGVRSLLSPTRLVNSTISGNSAGSLSPGGGIYADRGAVTVAHSTITDNHAAGVGGGIALPTLSTLLLTIRHSIVAGNTNGGGAPDLLGTGGLIPSEAIRYSLIGDNSGTALAESQAQNVDTGNIVGDPDGDGVIDPGLGPLSDNGGPTQTHPLLAESLAIDAGDSGFDPDDFSLPLNHDQRGDGFDRVVGDRIDLGAFESTVGLLIDFGDAPMDYPVTLGDDGARHLLSGLFLGADVDAEADGQPSPSADGDGDDEDGVTMIADAVAVTGTETVASWLVEASEAGKLDAWIDFNGDGDWIDAGEKVHSSVEVVAGPNLLAFTVPANANPGVTFARLRISSAGGLDPVGLAPDGEVEDHPLLILDGSSAPDALVTLIDPQTSIAADSDAIVVRQGSVEIFRVPSENMGSLAILGTDSDQVVDMDLLGLGIPVNGLEIDGGGGDNTVLVNGDGERVDLTQMAIGLSRFGRLDLSSPDANPLVIDVSAVARMSPLSGLIEIIAGSEDSISVTDAVDWRMGEPIIENGTFVLTAGHTGTGGESIRAKLPSGWRNFLRPADVNNDGQVSAGDALSVINELSRRAFSNPDTELLNDPLGVAVWPNRYFDHNGDNSVTALDALRVINDLARALSNNGSGEGEPTQSADMPLAGSFAVQSTVSPVESAAVESAVSLGEAMSPVEVDLDTGGSLVGSAGPSDTGLVGWPTVEASVQTRSDYASTVDELLSDELELDLLASAVRASD